jgi:hypothetical protein
VVATGFDDWNPYIPNKLAENLYAEARSKGW